jgi:nitroimidazol reductase NimA-like FMN-containing flavoprotein (pyridoxamine 5'-phosphate oxidase superfamily)
MKRKDREITDLNEILRIIEKCKVFRIATMDENGLYIIPLNFGYEYSSDKLSFFFHSAKEGRKVDAFPKNSKVAFEMDCENRLIEASEACSYGYAFQSIVGNGEISLVEDSEDKKRALSLLMLHQTGKDFVFDDNMAYTVLVYRVDVTNISAKHKI